MIDATLAFEARKRFKRAHHPVDKVELSKWFSEAELAAAHGLQSPWAKVLAKIGG